MMHALSLYLDTSVIGGYHDARFMADTRALWRLRNAGHYQFVSSDVVLREIAGAPESVRELMKATFALENTLQRTAESEELAGAYIAQEILPSAYHDDARHVALCT